MTFSFFFLLIFAEISSGGVATAHRRCLWRCSSILEMVGGKEDATVSVLSRLGASPLVHISIGLG